jgi:hypothetical protein
MLKCGAAQIEPHRSDIEHQLAYSERHGTRLALPGAERRNFEKLSKYSQIFPRF